MDPSALPHELPALVSIALLLGVRHGFDADHLAAIDGLTRTCSRHRPQLARSAGALFSLGHGLVVLAVALIVSHMQSRWSVPTWLELTGSWISILTLFALALVNGWMLWRTRSEDMHMAPTGWRSVVFTRLMASQRPGSIALVGALFALSFDTVSQASLFAVAATHLGGLHSAVLLAVVFTFGMMLTDGFNGAVVARMLRHADVTARMASRMLGWAVVVAGVLTAMVELASLLSPGFGTWMDDRGTALSLVVVSCVGVAFVAGLFRWGKARV